MTKSAETINVLVFGGAGRMGSTVVAAVTADKDLALQAAVDPGYAGETGSDSEVPSQHTSYASTADVEDPTGIDVAVDFTVAAAARQNAAWCAEHSIHTVIGTTGLSAADLEEFRRIFTASNCLVAPNFSIGAVLLARFAQMAAPYFDSVEVIEQHHNQKIDAPSGTAQRLVEQIAAASDEWLPDPTETQTIPGVRGGSGPAGIPVHAVRLRGLVAHHEVLLGTEGEVLTLRHDSLDRQSFMSGVLRACKLVGSRPGVTVGLENYLDF